MSTLLIKGFEIKITMASDAVEKCVMCSSEMNNMFLDFFPDLKKLSQHQSTLSRDPGEPDKSITGAQTMIF